MRHLASPDFWDAYRKPPDPVRELAVEVDGGLLWFWIGSHPDYDALIG